MRTRLTRLVPITVEPEKLTVGMTFVYRSMICIMGHNGNPIELQSGYIFPRSDIKTPVEIVLVTINAKTAMERKIIK